MDTAVFRFASGYAAIMVVFQALKPLDHSECYSGNREILPVLIAMAGSFRVMWRGERRSYPSLFLNCS